jgi:hypothetical protein
LVRDIATQQGLPFLDLRPFLTTAEGWPTPNTRLPEDGHLTASGNQLVASAVAKFLRDRDLLRTQAAPN